MFTKSKSIALTVSDVLSRFSTVNGIPESHANRCLELSSGLRRLILGETPGNLQGECLDQIRESSMEINHYWFGQRSMIPDTHSEILTATWSEEKPLTNYAGLYFLAQDLKRCNSLKNGSYYNYIVETHRSAATEDSTDPDFDARFDKWITTSMLEEYMIPGMPAFILTAYLLAFASYKSKDADNLLKSKCGIGKKIANRIREIACL